jgi:hypothetical protein
MQKVKNESFILKWYLSYTSPIVRVKPEDDLKKKEKTSFWVRLLLKLNNIYVVVEL